MNNALTADDLTDLVAIRKGAPGMSCAVRDLRTSELDDHGARLIGLGLAEEYAAHVRLTEAGYCELEARDLL